MIGLGYGAWDDGGQPGAEVVLRMDAQRGESPWSLMQCSPHICSGLSCHLECHLPVSVFLKPSCESRLSSSTSSSMLPSQISQQKGLLSNQILHCDILRMSVSRSDTFLHTLRPPGGQSCLAHLLVPSHGTMLYLATSQRGEGQSGCPIGRSV